MKRYPVVFLAACFILGILIDRFIAPPFNFSETIILSASLAVTGFIARRFTLVSSIVIGISFMFAALATCQHVHHKMHLFAFDDLPPFTKITVAGGLASEVTFKNKQFRFDFSVRAVEIAGDWHAVRVKVHVVSSKFPENYHPFGNLILRGNWLKAKGAAYPGGFDYRKFLQSKNIAGLIKVRKDGAVVVGHFSDDRQVERVFARARAKLWRIIRIIADSETAPILRGLFIGDRDQIAPEVVDAFASIGTIHVLAISGLHVGFVVLLVFWLSAILNLPRIPRHLLAIVVVWLFALFTGLKTPVFRAAIMFTVFSFGRLRDRSVDGFSLLSLTALIVLMVNPQELFAVGFQLSFSAVAGILYFYPKLENVIRRSQIGEVFWQFDPIKILTKISPVQLALFQIIRKRGIAFYPARYFIALFLVSLSAQLGTAPVIFSHFGTFSFISLAANLLIIPGIFLIIITSAFAFLLYPVFPLSSAFVGNIADALTHQILNISKYFASFSELRIVGFFPPVTYILVTVLAVLCLLEYRKKRLRFILLVFILLLLNWKIWTEIVADETRNMRITMLDVGQGDATVVSFPGGKTMLIDAGPVSQLWDAGEKVILPFLHKTGIKQIDMAVITHPHLDHFGGFLSLVQKIPICRAVFADTGYADKNFRHLVEMMKNNGVHISLVRRGEVLTEFDPVVIYVMGPQPVKAKLKRNWNQASLVLKIQYGKCSFLIGGDTELAGEADLLNFGDFLVSDLLKAGHHGSKTSSGLEFLQKVQPTWATISAGVFNKFKHPAVQVIERFANLSIQVARTDIEGALEFATDGHHLWRKVY